MPLPPTIRSSISEYCNRDLPGDIQWHVNQFSFMSEQPDLCARLGRAYYSARYIAKLLEGLQPPGDETHAFVKFQVIQYASIYEAVISYLLWTRFKTHPEVKALETHKAFKPVAALARLTSMTYGEETVFPCVNRSARTNRNSISFKDKVDCAVRVGFVNGLYADDIKRVYFLRNLTHIESEAESLIEVELADAKNGYWRMKPFLETITMLLSKDPNL